MKPAGGVHLASVGGVAVDLDYSWFVLFFLILATFSGVVFPGYAPGLSRTTHFAMGLAGTLLFFLSLLAHELAHAFVARWRGIEVEGITLFIFGGMARTRTEASSPGAEFQIAVVGPVMSLGLAAAFAGAALLVETLGGFPSAQAVAAHLAFLNLALAAFNLLPGFPLDGGRILRSLVWSATDDLGKATRVATAAGKLLGWLVVATGVWSLVVAGQLVGGLWFIFIGWFLVQTAEASYRHLLLRIVLEGRVARDAMTHLPETVGPDIPLDRLVHDYFLKRPFNSFPVTDDGIVVGLVTLSQVKPVASERWPDTRVADVMTELVDTVVVSPDTPMTEVLERMTEAGARRVVVARDWELRGIITAGDIANWLDRAGLLA